MLSDLGMPGMDGFELARRIRSIPALASIPLIAVTGFARDGDLKRSTEAGFVAHIGKPIVLDTPASTVEHARSVVAQAAPDVPAD